MWKPTRRHLFLGAGGTALALAARPAGAAPIGAGQIVLPWRVERIYDSRDPGAGGRLGSGMQRNVRILLPGPEPHPNIMFLNLTITETLGVGFLRVSPASETAEPDVQPAPATHSNINWFADGLNLANLVIVGLGEGNAVVVECHGGSTHFLLDLVAYVTHAGRVVG